MTSRYWSPLSTTLLVVVITVSIVAGIRYSSKYDEEISIGGSSVKEESGVIVIGGGVVAPGIYPLRPDDSISILIRAAGGRVPGSESGYLRLYLSEGDEKSEYQKVDLNRAEKWLLEALPGIGSSRANAIVSYREDNGPFKCTSEIMRIGGIGTKTFQEIASMISVAD